MIFAYGASEGVIGSVGGGGRLIKVGVCVRPGAIFDNYSNILSGLFKFKTIVSEKTKMRSK
jgi:hypothetical protein